MNLKDRYRTGLVRLETMLGRPSAAANMQKPCRESLYPADRETDTSGSEWQPKAMQLAFVSN